MKKIESTNEFNFFVSHLKNNSLVNPRKCSQSHLNNDAQLSKLMTCNHIRIRLPHDKFKCCL